MRRAVIAGLLTTCTALGAARLGAAQAFTGTVHYTMQGEDGKTTMMTQASKPGHYAIQFTNEGKVAEFIVDSTAGTTTVVNTEDKSYFVITKEMMQGMAGMMSGMASMLRRHADSSRTSADAKAVITPAGSSLVAGIPCQLFHYDAMNDNKHVTGDVCLAKGVGMGLFNMNPMGGMMGGGMGTQQRQGMLQDRLHQMGQVGVMLSQGYGILKATSIEDGKPKGSIEVTAIDRGTPPDAAFAPPPGYTEKNMGDMMRGGRRP